MKKIIGLICISFLAFTSKAKDEKIVDSKISKVTVYAQGAQIHRKASYSVSKGVTEVILEGISPNIDRNSLQVKASGNVIILDSKYSIYYPKPDEKPLEGLPLKIRTSILKLEDSIAFLGYDMQGLQDEINVYNATKNILSNNGAIRGQGKVNDSIALLKEAVDYYTLKMMEINKKLHVLNKKYADQQKELNGMNKRLTDLRNYQTNNKLDPKPLGPIHRVVVTLKTDATVSGSLNVSYLVSSAGWTPLYDLRSEITNGNVNLNYKAQVWQNTGIDWEDVRLNISTNNPYMNKTKPELHPWYVDYNYYYDQTKAEMQNKKYKGTPQPVTRDMEDASVATESLGGSISYNAQQANNFVNVVDQVISAEFQIDLPYTIKSNNEQHMVLVKNVDLDADYKYYTAPKYDRSVYLVAQISKLDELQLVPAKANIFFDGSYIGETYLDPSTMDDTLNLSLGKDPNIIVKRTLLKTESKEKVIGTKKERTFAYDIEIKNLKSSSIDVIVQDQIPITTNTDIEIETEEISKGKIDEKTGIIEWHLTLKPKANKEIKLTYKVIHNKDMNVPL